MKEGLARVAYIYEPNTKYIDQFKKDEQKAKSERHSIWSKNGYVTDRGFNGCVKQKNTAVKKATTSKPATSQPTLQRHQVKTKLLQRQLEKQKRFKIVLS